MGILLLVGTTLQVCIERQGDRSIFTPSPIRKNYTRTIAANDMIAVEAGAFEGTPSLEIL